MAPKLPGKKSAAAPKSAPAAAPKPARTAVDEFNAKLAGKKAAPAAPPPPAPDEDAPWEDEDAAGDDDAAGFPADPGADGHPLAAALDQQQASGRRRKKDVAWVVDMRERAKRLAARVAYYAKVLEANEAACDSVPKHAADLRKASEFIAKSLTEALASVGDKYVGVEPAGGEGRSKGTALAVGTEVRVANANARKRFLLVLGDAALLDLARVNKVDGVNLVLGFPGGAQVIARRQDVEVRA